MSTKAIVVLGLFGAAFVALKMMWDSDAALDAIILFGTAGVVPGTGVILTPAQVYMVLAAVLVLSVLLIFGKDIWRGVRRVRARLIARHKTPLETSASAPAAQAVTPVVAPITMSKPMVVITMPAQPGILVRVWRNVRPKLFMAAGTALVVGITQSARLAVVVRRFLLKMYRYGVRLWLWAEPHIRRMDRRIEATLKRNKDIAAALDVLGTASKTIHIQLTSLRRRLNSRFNRLPED
jgi:hypothetical protein